MRTGRGADSKRSCMAPRTQHWHPMAFRARFALSRRSDKRVREGWENAVRVGGFGAKRRKHGRAKGASVSAS